MYIVVCKDDGKYVVGTHTMFRTREEAESYASTVSPSREPLVVEYDGKPFRDDSHDRFEFPLSCKPRNNSSANS